MRGSLISTYATCPGAKTKLPTGSRGEERHLPMRRIAIPTSISSRVCTVLLLLDLPITCRYYIKCSEFISMKMGIPAMTSCSGTTFRHFYVPTGCRIKNTKLYDGKRRTSWYATASCSSAQGSGTFRQDG